MSEPRVEPTEPERKSTGTRQWVPGERAIWRGQEAYILVGQDEEHPRNCRVVIRTEVWDVLAADLEPTQVCPHCQGTGWTKA